MKEVTQEYRKKLMNSKFDMMQFNGVKEKNLCINSRVE